MNKKVLIYLAATVTWFMFTASTCFIAWPDIESSGDDRFAVQNNTLDTLVWVEYAYPKTLSDINPEAIFGMKWKYMIAPNEKGYNNSEKVKRAIYGFISANCHTGTLLRYLSALIR